MHTFKIYHIKGEEHGKEKTFKCIRLSPKFGGKRAFRNGFTANVFDLVLNHRKLKSYMNYYHDGYPEQFMSLLPRWLDSWYDACENSHYMWASMSFTPTLEVHKDRIIKTETKKIDNYEKLKKFLADFCVIDWRQNV